MFNLNKKIALVAILALTLGLGALGVSAGVAVPSAAVVLDSDSVGNAAYFVVITWGDGTISSSTPIYNQPVEGSPFLTVIDSNNVTVNFDVDGYIYNLSVSHGTATFDVPADTIAPTITLTPNVTTMDVPQNGVFIAPTATAVDDDGTDFTGSIATTSNVNVSVAGAYTYTYSVSDYAGNTASVSVTVNVIATPVVTLSSIAITTPANKLAYKVGDALDITGLVVTGTYSDGSTSTQAITTGNITGFNSSAAVTGQVLTITVNGKTATYTINVLSNSNSGGGGMGYTVGGFGGGTVMGTTTGQVLGASTLIFRTTLKLGSRGVEVKALQDYLRAQGFFTYPVSTGYFGPITLQALKNYQKAMLLKVTGMTDLTTRNILNLSTADHQKYLSLLIEYLKLQIEIAKLSV